MNLGNNNTIEKKLDILHKDANKDYLRVGSGVIKSIFRPLQPSDLEQAYLTITKEQGQYLRQLIIDNNCQNIIEFGTSFGISTIYLADAASKTGGNVISTELLLTKAQRAEQNIKEAGLSEYVRILIGDAMETLKDHSQPIDFLFIDGWKDLYLPVFKLLESCLRKNTIVYADNMDMSGTEVYAKYVLGKNSTYSTNIIHNGKAFLTKVV